VGESCLDGCDPLEEPLKTENYDSSFKISKALMKPLAASLKPMSLVRSGGYR